MCVSLSCWEQLLVGGDSHKNRDPKNHTKESRVVSEVKKKSTLLFPPVSCFNECCNLMYGSLRDKTNRIKKNIDLMRKTKLYKYPKWNPFQLFQVNMLRDCRLAPSKIMKSIANNSGKAERHVDGTSKILSFLEQNCWSYTSNLNFKFQLLISVNHINSNITKNTRKKITSQRCSIRISCFFIDFFTRCLHLEVIPPKVPTPLSFHLEQAGCSWFQVNGDCTVIYLVIQWVQVDNDRDNRGS